MAQIPVPTWQLMAICTGWFCVNLIQARIIRKEGVRKRQTYPLVDSYRPGLVVLVSIKKQAKQAMGSKSVAAAPSMASPSAPASEILPCVSSCPDFLWSGCVSQINPFFLACYLVTVVVCCSNRNPTRIMGKVLRVPNSSFRLDGMENRWFGCSPG